MNEPPITVGSLPDPAADRPLAPEDESLRVSNLNRQAKRGIKLLLGRQVLLQILTLGGGIILARTLTPAEFGLYAIATFVVSTISLFGDFGLSPLLIQRKQEISARDLQVGFTLQQII